jgi:hypothetical protein
MFSPPPSCKIDRRGIQIRGKSTGILGGFSTDGRFGARGRSLLGSLLLMGSRGRMRVVLGCSSLG